MKKLFTSSVIIFFLGFSSISVRSQSCSNCRYLSPIFDSVTMETVQFGRGVRANGDTQQLYMDIYQPYGDTLINRPAAIFAFGGAFVTGSRDDWYVKLVCNRLAKAGYVVASIDYRIYDNITEMITEIFASFSPPQQMRIFFRPMQDMRGAVQYLKADYSELGNNYRIDTSKILIGGASSGAITSLMTAYCDKDSEMAEMGYGSLTPLTALGGFYSTTGFYPNYSWKAAATFNVSGAIFNANWIEPGDIPVICAHGDADQVVVYKRGGFAGVTAGLFEMEGSYLVDSVARAKGVCSYLYTMEGRDHPSEDMGIEYFNSVVNRMLLRMYAVINDRSFCCPFSVDVTPGDTLVTTLTSPPVTLNAQLANDPGNLQMKWCSMPCAFSGTSSSITFQPDTSLRYVMNVAYDNQCQASDLYIVFDSLSLIPAGIENVNPDIDFSVYPQPASDFAIVTCNFSRRTSPDGVIEVTDLSGRKIYSSPFQTTHLQLKTTIPVRGLAAGNYLLEVKTANGFGSARKITVVR